MPEFRLIVNVDSGPEDHVNDVLGAMHEVAMDLEGLRGEPMPPAGTVQYPLGVERAAWTFDGTVPFTAREACTVLAALRCFQGILLHAKPGLKKDVTFDASDISSMTHFESCEPLSVDDIDGLCERITIDLLPEIEKAGTGDRNAE